MRDLFPGYYQPTEKEFAELWKECIFSFDTNVLLHIYRYKTSQFKNGRGYSKTSKWFDKSRYKSILIKSSIEQPLSISIFFSSLPSLPSLLRGSITTHPQQLTKNHSPFLKNCFKISPGSLSQVSICS
ncbi:MAG: hypothetical protein RLZZ507_408 [Cyanobacteriota bacterium]